MAPLTVATGRFGVDKNQRNPVAVSFATTRANQKPASITITVRTLAVSLGRY